MASTRMTRRAFLGRATCCAGLAAVMGGKSGCDQSDEADAQRLPAAYRYDIARLAADDGGLPRCLTVSSVATGLVGAWAMSSAGSRTLVVGHDERVVVLDVEGNVVGGWAIEGRGTGLACDGEGGVAVVHGDGVVELYSLEGRRAKRWDLTDEVTHATAVALSGDDLFMADAGAATVSRYHKDDLIWRQRGFHVPGRHFHLALGLEGLIWVAHTGRHRLEAYDFSGELREHWGEPGVRIDGFSGCCNPFHFAIMADGRFVTSEKGLHRVKLSSSDGQAIAMVMDAVGMGVDVNSPQARGSGRATVSSPLVATLKGKEMAVLHPLTGTFHVLEAPKEISRDEPTR